MKKTSLHTITRAAHTHETPDMSATRADIRAHILEFLSGPDNSLHLPGSAEAAFADPLIGFAAGDDAIWAEYKHCVDACHWTPLEAFRLAFPQEDPLPEALTVISWVLPQTAATKRDQRAQRELTSERWARARIMGERYVNEGLRRHLVEALARRGVRATAPALLPEWGRRESERLVYVSNWSERHAAHAAGLGTFGLCDGLITPVGKAMRVGSVIAAVPLPPSPRPYTSHREYCLFFTSGRCGKCITRCPAGALSKDGHDKRRCKDYVQGVTRPYVKEAFHFDGYGCGLCQTGVPCESGIPRSHRECLSLP